jgi:dephospho-CoA kinase
VSQRGIPEEDAKARIAAQVSREERLKLADIVVDNTGPRSHLDPQIDRVWEWIESLRPAPE